MGLNAFFSARIDYQDKEKRLEDKTMEYVWRPMYDTFGDDKQIFHHVLYHHYSAPSGFDFDTLSNDQPFETDELLKTYNAPERAAELLDWVTHQAEHYMSQKHMMITWGDDFHYQDGHKIFKQLDNMIGYWNENMVEATNIQLQYSTPSMYVDAIAAENIKWPTKYDDILPYADNSASFWTGYFSSRANDKKYMRDASHTLSSSSKLFSLAAINQETSDAEIAEIVATKDSMMSVVGIIQHHDGITGTAKQHVADDYMNRIAKGIAQTNPVYAE
jgi:hypothetical protein